MKQVDMYFELQKFTFWQQQLAAQDEIIHVKTLRKDLYFPNKINRWQH